VHEWRAASDAVAVGIGTALTDDPLLTARVGGSDSESLASRQPRRVIFDSLAKLPLSSRLLDQASAVPLTVVVSRAAPRTATDALEARGVDVLCATGENEQARVRSALDQLGAAEVTSLLLEGGPKLAGVFLDADEIDEVRLFVAPLLLGGRGARDPLESEGVESVSDALRSLTLGCDRIGEDLLVTARIKEW
jgi:diaminohydroxyphosphoribosylaminopyrimidine deaminase/5-amino-6-(5-phosphoribosylamino)uracil reductase